MRKLAAIPARPALAPAAVGAAGVVLVAAAAVRVGATLSLGVLFGLCLFLAVLVAFVQVPHVAVAFTIPYFAALPMLKVLVSSKLGPTKDLIELAALLAGVVLAIQMRAHRREWHGDRLLVAITLLLVALYILNIGGSFTGDTGYGLAWFHGVRLVAEPLLLMVVGMVLKDPRRTLRWGIAALIATAYGAALIGLVQQELGGARLVSFGFEYGKQVRTIGSHLRSFGSFDQPFDYAAMLALGLAGVVLWLKRPVVAICAGIVIVAGLTVSFVRGAVLSAAALLGLLLARKGHGPTAALLLGSAAVASVVFIFLSTQPTAGRVVQADSSTYLTLNGRTTSWRLALGKPISWPFGRGVGAYGTAAQRAESARALALGGAPTAAADSGYLATTSDVGFIGLLLLLALFGRVLVLFRRALELGEEIAWFGLGVTLIFMLDAALRSSFTGFPTAHVAMLMIGLTLAAASAGHRLSEPVRSRATFV